MRVIVKRNNCEPDVVRNAREVRIGGGTVIKLYTATKVYTYAMSTSFTIKVSPGRTGEFKVHVEDAGYGAEARRRPKAGRAK